MRQRRWAVAEDPRLKMVTLAELLAKCSHDTGDDEGNGRRPEDVRYLAWEV